MVSEPMGWTKSFLRYLKVGTTYNPDIVFIGYMSENIARNVNIFRPFYTGDGGHIYFHETTLPGQQTAS